MDSPQCREALKSYLDMRIVVGRDYLEKCDGDKAALFQGEIRAYRELRAAIDSDINAAIRNIGG